MSNIIIFVFHVAGVRVKMRRSYYAPALGRATISKPLLMPGERKNHSTWELVTTTPCHVWDIMRRNTHHVSQPQTQRDYVMSVTSTR